MTDTQAIVPTQGKQAPVILPEFGLTITQLSATLVRSGFFGKALTPEQAMTKILIGHEMGMPPVISLQQIDVFEGNIFIRSNWRATKIKATPGADYRVTEHDDDHCTIEFYHDGKLIGTSTYTMQDAAKAGLAQKDNWRKAPKNMLFARALANGQRWHVPEAMNGIAVYDPDEKDEIMAVKQEKATTAAQDLTASVLAPKDEQIIDGEVVEEKPKAAKKAQNLTAHVMKPEPVPEPVPKETATEYPEVPDDLFAGDESPFASQ